MIAALWKRRQNYVIRRNKGTGFHTAGSERKESLPGRLPRAEGDPLFLSEGYDRRLHEAGLPFTLLSDPEKEVIQAYDVWKEKKNYGKVSMGVVRTTYLIDEDGIIVKAFDKVKAADKPAQMLGVLS